MKLSFMRLATFLAGAPILWTAVHLHARASRDPTSLFFNPRVGYTPRYSLIRRKQALDFIQQASTRNTTHAIAPEPGPREKKICVGIPSVAREGGGYLRETVGSLLHGLSEGERAGTYFAVLIPHSDPGVHSVYAEAWLHDLADEVLAYDGVDAEEVQHIKDMEENDGPEYKEKGLYDYRFLLRHCAQQHTPYIAIFEDDVVAVEGWYRRTMAELKDAERQSALRHASVEFLYLRLFYTEEFLGWNSEDWPRYLVWSVTGFAVPMLLLMLFRERFPSTKCSVLDTRVMVLIAALLTSSIALFFALGRITVAPLPDGVSLMPNFGCCSQALVFPRGRALMLATYMKDRRTGPPDVLIEDYANENGELRWAISPSVVQHVGRKSSKMDDFGTKSKYGMSVAEKIWSFGFEQWDEGAIRP